MDSTTPPTLITLWRAATTRYGPRPALLTVNGWSATYIDVSTAASAIEASLNEAGLRPGNAVLICLSRGPLWLPALLAIWRAGGVAVPVRDGDPNAVQVAATHTAGTLELRDGATAITGWPAGFDIRPIDPPPAGTAVTTAAHAYAMPTSGSTGKPKHALVAHATAAAVMTGLHRTVPIADGERALHTAAFTFSSSIRQLLLPLLGGATVSIFDRGDRFDPRRLLQVVNDLEITMLDLTPSQLAAVTHWLELDDDPPVPTGLKRLLVASEAFAPALLTRWKRVVPIPHTVFHLYGQTELGGAISALALPEWPVADDSGRLPLAPPFPPFMPTLDERPDGLAELLVRGLDPYDGYLTPSGLDRSRFVTTDGEHTALYRTGDLFAPLPGGTMAFQGRADNEVKILGVRIDALRIEQFIGTIPGVVHVAVLPFPGPDGSTTLRAAYTTTGSQDAVAAVAETLAGQLDPTLPPPVPVRLDTMPLTTSGKIDRPALLRILQQMSAPPPDDDGDTIAALWRRFTHPGNSDQPDEHQDFFAAGGHSLSMLELLAELHRHHGSRVLPEQFHQTPTLAGLRSLVQRHAPTRPSTTATSQVPEPRRSGRMGELPPNTLQRQVWLAEQLSAGQTPSPFWLSIDLDVPDRIDAERLGCSLQLVVSRFDILRVTFARRSSSLIMLPDAVPSDRFTIHRADTADDAVPVLRLTPMAAGGPLLHVGLSESPNGTTIGIRVHHSVVDRRSIALLLQAMAAAYTDPGGFAAAPAAPSFLGWNQQHTETSAAERDAAAAYWHSTLPTQPAARIQPGPPQIERATMQVPSPPDPDLGTTPHAMWLWAYRVALAAQQVPQPELIGVDIDLRAYADLDLVGPCVHTLPIVIPADTLTGEQGPRAAMAAIVRVLPHRAVPISDVVPANRRPTGDPRQPFFRNSLVYQPDPYPELRFGGRLAHYRRTPEGIAGNTVTLYVRNVGTSTTLELAWDTRMVDEHVARGVLTTTADILGLMEKGRP
jgi:acyl-coenzyme A synthetase/AMP-(fatty) acid ligase